MALHVAELAPGLWRWTAPHPEWTPQTYADEGWEEDVGCLYWEAPDAICLVDPLIPTDERDREELLRHLDVDVERARVPVVVLVTVFWHERSAAEVVERYGARRWGNGEPLPGGLEAVDVARRGEVVFVVPSDPPALVAGDVLLGQGDSGLRVCPDGWFAEPDGPTKARAALRPLVDRELGLVVVSHGEPVTTNARDALRRALDA